MLKYEDNFQADIQLFKREWMRPSYSIIKKKNPRK